MCCDVVLCLSVVAALKEKQNMIPREHKLTKRRNRQEVSELLKLWNVESCVESIEENVDLSCLCEKFTRTREQISALQAENFTS